MSTTIESASRVLYWLTHDLRLSENQIFSQTSRAQSLLCVYCIDPDWFTASRYQTPQMSAIRLNFLHQCLDDLKLQLEVHGQKLHIIMAKPAQAITNIIEEQKITHLVLARQFGWDEQQQLNQIKAYKPKLQIIEFEQSTLFSAEQVAKNFTALNKGFTPFKNAALPHINLNENNKSENVQLAAPPKHITSKYLQTSYKANKPQDAKQAKALLQGGEQHAQLQLQQYFQNADVHNYKQTRNKLSGFYNSSKLSAFLNSGCLSPQQILKQLAIFELEHGQSESSQWLVFELLWREYFHWLGLLQGRSLFSFRGLRKKAPLTSFYGERFQKWCHGNTPYPLVNACMLELKSTGYLSNRGRQIVASCLVNELNLDWRYGAAWFEYQLIDYQVCVNWGNWQYIAGVGVDPRGGRHFNIDKQQQQYDPNQQYINQWCGALPTGKAIDSVDAADWPTR